VSSKRAEGLAKHLPLAKIMNTASCPHCQEHVHTLRGGGLAMRGRDEAVTQRKANECIRKPGTARAANWAKTATTPTTTTTTRRTTTKTGADCCFFVVAFVAVVVAQFSPLALVASSPDNCSWAALLLPQLTPIQQLPPLHCSS